MTKTNRRAASQVLPTIYGMTMLNAAGEYETVADICRQMQADGTDQRIIDRWVQGLEMRARIAAGTTDLVVRRHA